VAGFVKVAEIQDVPAGQRKKVNVGGKHIALFNIEGTYYAIDDTCTHKGGPLLEGEIQGSNLTCPWHGAIFDVKTGEVLRPPAPIGVPVITSVSLATTSKLKSKRSLPATAVLVLPKGTRLNLSIFRRHPWAQTVRLTDSSCQLCRCRQGPSRHSFRRPCDILFEPTPRLAATGLLIPYAAELRAADAHREWHRRFPAILQDSTRERRGTIFLTCTRICFTSLSVEADGLPARLALCQRVRQP